MMNFKFGRPSLMAISNPAALSAGLAARPRQSGKISGNVTMIWISGMLTQHGPGGYDDIASQLRRALADDSDAIILQIDSSGGEFSGSLELAEAIYSARRVKPVIAQVNPEAGSAAFLLACAASEIYAIPSGEVGGLGIVAVHADQSEAMKKAGVKVTLISAGKYKVEGNPWQQLDPEARAFLQSRIDDAYSMMVTAIAKYRGQSPAQVREKFGKGRMLGAHAAKKAGMIDSVMTTQGLQRRLKANTSRSAALCRMVLETL